MRGNKEVILQVQETVELIEEFCVQILRTRALTFDQSNNPTVDHWVTRYTFKKCYKCACINYPILLILLVRSC